jgi:hypothetical protein
MGCFWQDARDFDSGSYVEISNGKILDNESSARSEDCGAERYLEIG